MFKPYKKVILFLAGFLFFTTSCDKGFEDLNVDPNQPSRVPAVNLLTEAQFRLTDVYWGRALNFELGMLMVQHFAQNEYTSEQRYVMFNSNYNNSWANFYAVGLYDLEAAKKIVESEANLAEGIRKNQLAIIALVRAWAFQTMTDIWGAIPYSQALSQEFSQPVYDSQQSIYTSLISEVSTAIDNLDPAFGAFGAGDQIYGSNITRWRKFAATLLLRMGLRVSDVDATLAQSAVNKAISTGIISEAAEAAKFPYQTDQRIANPMYVDASVNNRDDFCVTDVLINHLVDTDDPRLDAFARKTATDEYIGMPFGLPDGDAFALKGSTSRPTNTIRAANAPGVIMSFSEAKFLLAEAIARGLTAGNAETEYNNAVTASMNEWGISDATAVADYLAANSFGSYAGGFKEAIGTQKWIALYSNGLEAWAEHRRLDFPVLSVPAAASISTIPVRLVYPSSENGTNSENLVAAGNNNLTSKMWWDVN